MAEFPAGATIIPNPVNRVASFAIRDHYFFPGFPQMAWPMLDWVLATRQPPLVGPPSGERAIVVYGAGESQLLPLMNACVARYPQLKLFSLPSFLPDGGRRLELGVRASSRSLDAALAELIAASSGRLSLGAGRADIGANVARGRRCRRRIDAVTRGLGFDAAARGTTTSRSATRSRAPSP
jgi:molybdopterin-biosynthesis enzyme MoeA-like protein